MIWQLQVLEEITTKTYPLTQSDHELIASALEVLEKNFDDGVYNHTVGGAIRCKNGNIYLGVNCDGIHGSCAEYIAIGAAITAGEREFDTIVATHDKALNGLLPPCGNCRQMLFNYCPDVKVILNDEHGTPVKVDVQDLLPLAYTRIIVSE
ncbi:cytidine/deoxycytidylate deaminase family protein [Paenibacillus oceani]|uniref:Cytidine deaminase n=1 Tax=Paenibacillus oceani TaxID=2772510 RepID=A0A927C6B7_9BACL|nr:cytidine deaminase [Paenibacillus oceani]MBD2862168.1 cytidine deaminase [Paenibacillus oceani]